jgi:predicted nuclease of predicted toxin-antitoxin system
MNLYLDDNLAEEQLLRLLAKGGHSVVRPADVGMVAVSDAKHLECAIRNNWTLLTGDREDFNDMHQLILTSGGSHPGILVVRYERDSTKNMKPKHIAAAVTKLEKSGMACTDTLIVLNQWR